jgi:O-antigen/teichoic acid export membrane protein
MNSATTPPVEVVHHTTHNATRRQIRGSSLMLVGRTLSMAVNAVVQIYIVRYLAKPEYGAFALALSIVSMGEVLVSLGMDKAIARFVPIYQEHRDYNKMFGTIILTLGTMLSLGLALVLLVYGFQGFFVQLFTKDQDQQLTTALLLILIVLSPVQALDDLMVGLFAVFVGARSIFFRRHVLAPGLKLAVVAALILGNSNVYFLAVGYLAAGVLGVGICTVLLLRIMHQKGIFEHFDLRSIKMPVAELFAFSIPLLSTDLLYQAMNSMDAVLLGHFRGAVDIAAFRSVQSAAGLNQLAMMSFQTLFTPLAARMFARKDDAGINDLYWQTAVWMAIISFPIFAMTFSLAQPLTVLLFTKKYADSAPILALLSLGYYFSTALGFNGLTIRVFGKMRYVVVINILAALVNLSINLLLIPMYGAIGAAIGTCGTMIVHNILKQIGLRLSTNVKMFEWRYFKVYGVIVVSAIGLLLIQRLAGSHIYIEIPLVALVSFLVLVLNRNSLNVGQIFPELLRFPLARRFFGEAVDK